MDAPLDHAAHPLEGPRRIQRRMFVAGCIALAGAIGWACWPLGGTTVELPEPPTRAAVAAPNSGEREMLDLAAFGAPIWDPPPKPPKVDLARTSPAPVPPPTPLKLQLLGIVRQNDEDGNERFVAAIYDQTADRIMLLRDGDRIGSSADAGDLPRVTRITSEAVELIDASGPRRLVLREARRPITGLKLLSGAGTSSQESDP
ncbi:MAG: hypothetical protein AB7Q91_04975 [Phycisphaerales bacterium]